MDMSQGSQASQSSQSSDISMSEPKTPAVIRGVSDNSAPASSPQVRGMDISPGGQGLVPRSELSSSDEKRYKTLKTSAEKDLLQVTCFLLLAMKMNLIQNHTYFIVVNILHA